MSQANHKLPSDEYVERGNLVYRKGKKYRVRLLRCPICSKEFGWRGGVQRQQHYLHDHTPEDFDL